MYVVYDKEGKEIEFSFSIDARQAVDSGTYFAVQPKKNKKGPNPEEDDDKQNLKVDSKRPTISQKRGPKSK